MAQHANKSIDTTKGAAQGVAEGREGVVVGGCCRV